MKIFTVTIASNMKLQWHFWKNLLSNCAKCKQQSIKRKNSHSSVLDHRWCWTHAWAFSKLMQKADHFMGKATFFKMATISGEIVALMQMHCFSYICRNDNISNNKWKNPKTIAMYKRSPKCQKYKWQLMFAHLSKMSLHHHHLIKLAIVHNQKENGCICYNANCSLQFILKWHRMLLQSAQQFYLINFSSIVWLHLLIICPCQY